MAIIAPTIDRFDETTVMRMLRKLIGWIKDDLIEQINNNDISSVDKIVDGMSFNIDLVKGDGTKIPVGQITLDDNDKNVTSGEFVFDTNNRELSGVLKTGDGSEIEIPAVTIPTGTGGDVDDFVSGVFNYSDNQLTLTLNRESGTNPLVVPPVTIAGGGGTGGNPYPTAISGTVTSTGQIQLSITMNEGSPLTGNIDMSYFASADDLEEIQTQLTDITISTTVSQDSSNVIKVSNAVNGNSADLKLDLSIVGTDIILTAENSDGTQQAISKIAVGDIPFEKGIEEIEYIGNGYIKVNATALMNYIESFEGQHITRLDETKPYYTKIMGDKGIRLINYNGSATYYLTGITSNISTYGTYSGSVIIPEQDVNVNLPDGEYIGVVDFLYYSGTMIYAKKLQYADFEPSIATGISFTVSNKIAHVNKNTISYGGTLCKVYNGNVEIDNVLINSDRVIKVN